MSPSVRYSPSTAWTLDRSLGIYGPYNNTVHSTTQDSATVSIQFTGTSISLTCLLWPTGSNFTATLDGALLGTYDTSVLNTSSAASKTIFNKTDLAGTGQHTLVVEKSVNVAGWVSSIPGDDKSHLNIDSFVIGGQTVSSASEPTTPASGSGIQTGAIAGIIVGVLALLILVLGFLWYRRRKTQRTRAPLSTIFTEPKLKHIDEASLHAAETSSSPPIIAASSSPIHASPPRARQERREKIGLPFANQAEGPGSNSRRRWRSSLFELPGHRVVRAQSRMPPPRTASFTNGEANGSASNVGAPTVAGNAIRFASPPPLSIPTNSQTHLVGSSENPHTVNGGGRSIVPETLFSPLSGPGSHITDSTHHQSESTIPPSAASTSDVQAPLVPSHSQPQLAPTFGSSPSQPSSQPSSSLPRIRKRTGTGDTVPEKSSFQGNGNRQDSATGSSLPLTASTIPADLLSPTSDGVGSAATGGVSTTVLMRELAGLRDQVRQLTEIHRGGALAVDDRSPYPEPPPEYVGRDHSSDEEDGDEDDERRSRGRT